MNSDDENTFLSLVPKDGTAIGNIKLQRLLNWDTERYATVKRRLLQRGLISPGKGQGGSIRLVEADMLTLLTRLPPSGARITHPKLTQSLNWNPARYEHVVQMLLDEGLIARGPRNTISIIRTADIDDWLISMMLPEGPTSVFDAATLATQLGWTVEEVWQARARLIEREHQEAACTETKTNHQTTAKGSTQNQQRTRGLTHQDAVTQDVFVAYARADEEWRSELSKHLSAFRRSGAIRDWSDQEILPGQEWSRSIREKLDRADIILLLVSAEFLHSDYCHEVEMTRAVERHEAGEAVVIPIILRACDWQATTLAKLQALPKGAKPISLWLDRDEAFHNVVEGIRATVQARNTRADGSEVGPAKRSRKGR